jgi:hypothetical protein
LTVPTGIVRLTDAVEPPLGSVKVPAAVWPAFAAVTLYAVEEPAARVAIDTTPDALVEYVVAGIPLGPPLMVTQLLQLFIGSTPPQSTVIVALPVGRLTVTVFVPVATLTVWFALTPFFVDVTT